MGRAGFRLTAACLAPPAPPEVRQLPAIERLRRTWVQQYVIRAAQVHLREPKDRPPAAEQVESPYEAEARYGSKGGTRWAGYKPT